MTTYRLGLTTAEAAALKALGVELPNASGATAEEIAKALALALDAELPASYVQQYDAGELEDGALASAVDKLQWSHSFITNPAMFAYELATITNED